MSGFFTGLAAAAEFGSPWGAAITITIGVIVTGISTTIGIWEGRPKGSGDDGDSQDDGGFVDWATDLITGGDDADDDSKPSGLHNPDSDMVYQYNGMHISDANEVGYHEIKTRRQQLFIKSYLRHIGTALAVAVPTYIGRRRVAKAIHNWRHNDDVPNTPLPDQILRATGLDYNFGTPPRKKRRPYRVYDGFRYRPH